jgi:hypothetical protein
MRLDWWSMSDGHIPEAINGQQRITRDDEERRARATAKVKAKARGAVAGKEYLYDVRVSGPGLLDSFWRAGSILTVTAPVVEAILTAQFCSPFLAYRMLLAAADAAHDRLLCCSCIISASRRA